MFDFESRKRQLQEMINSVDELDLVEKERLNATVQTVFSLNEMRKERELQEAAV